MNYHRQKVEILIDKKSSLYRKIVKRAERDGVAVESIVEMLMNFGGQRILDQTLKDIERREAQE